MRAPHIFETQSVVRFFAIMVAALCFPTALLVVAETNEVERAMVTDSDADGMTDWNEWQAGTNPSDPTNCLEITHVETEDGKTILKWKSVGTNTYEIVRSTTVTGLATNPQHVAFVQATGAIAPWHETISTVTNNLTGPNSFFRIRVLVPQNFEQSTLDMATFE